MRLPLRLEGVVVEGEHRGRALGFPTANLELASGYQLPPSGIYVGSARGHRAAISVGVNPHYGGTPPHVEVYLLDFDGDLYGQLLEVELWERLRDEAAFESEQALVEQIARDVEAARRARRPG
jgi:riboflavin kinase/FMN adenylyltransferase